MLVIVLLGVTIYQYAKTTEFQSDLLALIKDRDDVRGELRKLNSRVADLQKVPATSGTRSAEVKPVTQSPAAFAPAAAQGSPSLSANYQAMYSVDSGWLKGLKLGGSYQGTWKRGSHYC